MIKKLLLLTFATAVAMSSILAQNAKPTPNFKPTNLNKIELNAPANPQLKRDHQAKSIDFSLQEQLAAPSSLSPIPGWKFVKDPDDGQIIAGKGELLQRNWGSLNAQATSYLETIGGLQKTSDDMSFQITRTNQSSTGTHLRFIQTYQGLPLLGTEGVLHAKDGVIHSFNGRLKKAISIDTAPKQSVDEAVEIAKNWLAAAAINWQEIPTDKLILIENRTQVQSALKIAWDKENQPRLVWELALYPNIQERWIALIDAHQGTVLSCIPAFCQLWHNPLEKESCGHHHSSVPNAEEVQESSSFLPPGPETAQAQDLLGVNRTINVYEEGGNYYMIDASRDMFNSSLSNFPDDPRGVIWTLDAGNTYPENNNFNYSHVTSGNNIWNNRNAVSAHYNGGTAYEYFRSVHNRNSINGQGGRIISMIRVSDPNGNDFDNAFWNGAAMFYGNGDQAFNASLAKGLDVAGHEMSHGVIQATANLAYQNQSGAMNESFADIFGAMIDRDDWFIGEDVANPSVFPSGRMRDMSDPHNGGNSSNFYWQPKHMDEFRNLPNTQDGDWGGVHINSGIPNHAFFRFATSVGKDDAEKVFYEVLENHLTANSKFIDLRIGVVQVAGQLLGANGQAAARTAFDQVGILDGEGTNVQQDINENPGDEVVIWSDLNNIGLYFPADDITSNLTTGQHLTRPSITDDGSYAVFIDAQNRIRQIEIDWQNSMFNESFFETNPQTIWRNVAVSKDGSKIAVLSTDLSNSILVFDRVTGTGREFELYNPTTAAGVNSGDVQYADVLEWDVSGEYIMYDAFNELQNNTFEDISYWDIGLIRVWSNNSNNFGEGQIQKVFNGLSENESVGNPTFSKNSPYIIAFDYISTDVFGSATYKVFGANIETGKLGEIWENAKLGYPSYSPEDNQILFSADDTNGQPVLGKRELMADKITGVNNPTVLVAGPTWGHWFANGQRPLVSTEEFFTGSLNIFPNPADQQLQIELTGLEKGKYQLRLINVLGSVVHLEDIGVTGGFAQESLDVSVLSAGTYFLEISNDLGHSLAKKVMIK